MMLVNMVSTYEREMVIAKVIGGRSGCLKMF